MTIQREALSPLLGRLKEPRRFLQVLAGPRQVGKTTLVRQALEHLRRDAQVDARIAPQAQHSASADGPGLQGQVWLGTQWQVARALAAQAGSCVLVLDEIQKVSNWTEEVKRLWDEDTATGSRCARGHSGLGPAADCPGLERKHGRALRDHPPGPLALRRNARRLWL